LGQEEQVLQVVLVLAQVVFSQFLVQLLLLHQRVVVAELEVHQVLLQMVHLVVQEVVHKAIHLLVEQETHLQ
jgi:hypothetical protein